LRERARQPSSVMAKVTVLDVIMLCPPGPAWIVHPLDLRHALV
jgi:hypothetical protein